jgi:hypothetical protein
MFKDIITKSLHPASPVPESRGIVERAWELGPLDAEAATIGELRELSNHPGQIHGLWSCGEAWRTRRRR